MRGLPFSIAYGTRRLWAIVIPVAFAIAAETASAEGSSAGLLLAFNSKSAITGSSEALATNVLTGYRSSDAEENGLFVAYIVPKASADYTVSVEVLSNSDQTIIRCLSTTAQITDLASTILINCPWGGFLPQGGLRFKITVTAMGRREILGEIYLPDRNKREDTLHTEPELTTRPIPGEV